MESQRHSWIYSLFNKYFTIWQRTLDVTIHYSVMLIIELVQLLLYRFSVLVLLVMHCVFQLCNGPSKVMMESRRMPFSEQTHNTPVSASATGAPPSTTIVASCVNTANVNMDASQFSVGPYDDFAVSISCMLEWLLHWIRYQGIFRGTFGLAPPPSLEVKRCTNI